MAIDWALPLRQLDGSVVHLRAMMRENGAVVPLSSMELSKEITGHFGAQYGSGVRFMVTKKRENSKPIYYRRDGTPWLDHHPALRNVHGMRLDLETRAAMAADGIAENKADAEVRRKHAIAIRNKLRESHDAAVAARSVETSTMESNPLWGVF